MSRVQCRGCDYKPSVHDTLEGYCMFCAVKKIKQVKQLERENKQLKKYLLTVDNYFRANDISLEGVLRQ